MNKVAIITGASQGIGQATALLFLQQGWKVINISRQNCTINDITNLNADFLQSDWEKALIDPLQHYLQTSASIALIHNAALCMKDNMAELTINNLRQSLEVNVIAASILNRIVLPYMNEGSAIIYIGSTLSEKAVPNAASYVVTKHAVLGMMRATCQDLASRKIHTCCICPGFTDTEMLRSHLQNEEAIIEIIKDKVTFKRLIKPQEIASLVYFCAQNPVINGAVLHANLGQVES